MYITTTNFHQGLARSEVDEWPTRRAIPAETGSSRIFASSRHQQSRRLFLLLFSSFLLNLLWSSIRLLIRRRVRNLSNYFRKRESRVSTQLVILNLKARIISIKLAYHIAQVATTIAGPRQKYHHAPPLDLTCTYVTRDSQSRNKTEKVAYCHPRWACIEGIQIGWMMYAASSWCLVGRGWIDAPPHPGGACGRISSFFVSCRAHRWIRERLLLIERSTASGGIAVPNQSTRQKISKLLATSSSFPAHVPILFISPFGCCGASSARSIGPPARPKID